MNNSMFVLNCGTTMSLVRDSNKAIQKAIRVVGKKRIKKLRAEVLKKLGAEVVSTFKGIELSDAFKAYADLLLVSDCIKTSKKQIVNAYVKTVMDCKVQDKNVFTSEECEVARGFFENVVKVAYSSVIAEVKETFSNVEKELNESIDSNTFKILGVDFSGKSHDFKMALFGNKTIRAFNELVKCLYASTLNKEEVKKQVTDEASMTCRHVLYNLVFLEGEEVNYETKKEIVDSFYKQSNETNYQTRFDKLENVGYCYKGVLMTDIEKRYNEVVNHNLVEDLEKSVEKATTETK